MRAFVSHISEESALATCLKDWIESALLGQCEVFISSDSAALPGGVKWLTKIDEALKSADVMLVICSAASIVRPWINFETGCAWSRGIPVIPLCHSGIQKGTLPRPISDFQAIDLHDPKFAQLLLEALQVHFRLAKLPRINNAEMQSEINEAISKMQNSSIQLANVGVTPLEASTELRDEGYKILRFLGQRSERANLEQISSHFRWNSQQTNFFLEELDDLGLIYTYASMLSGISYILNPKGRKFLFEHGML